MALEAVRANRTADSVQADTSLQRLALPGDTLLMVQRPFGEALGLRTIVGTLCVLVGVVVINTGRTIRHAPAVPADNRVKAAS